MNSIRFFASLLFRVPGFAALKNAALLCALSAFMALVPRSFAQWQQTEGPGGGFTTQIYAKGDLLFAGNFEHYTLSNADGVAGTLYRSTDHAQSWAPANTGFKGVPVGFANSDTTLFVATSTDGIFKSTNDGTSWSALATSRQFSAVNLLYVNGALYAGTVEKGVYKSVDNGNTFVASNNGLPDLPSIVDMTHVDTTLFIGVSTLYPRPHGVYRSADGGATWVQVNNGLGAASISALDVKGSTLFATTAGLDDGGVYRSLDLGATWTRSDSGISGQPEALHVAGDGSIYVSVFAADYTGHSIYRSTNDGASWTKTGPGIPFTEVTISFASIGAEVFTGLADYGSVYRTSNSGVTWEPGNIGLTEVDVRAIFPSGSYLFSGSLSDPGIHRSSDGGITWVPSGAGLPEGYKSVGAFAQNASYLFAGIDYLGAYRSSDSGATWQPAASGFTAFGVFIHAFTVNGTDVYAGTEDGVFKTINNGTNWTIASPKIGSGRPQVLSMTALNGNIFAGTSINGISKSSNNGLTWMESDNGIPFFSGIYSLLVKGSDLIAGTGTGVYLSADGGTTWTARNNGLAPGAARTVAAQGDTLVTSIFDVTNLVSKGTFISEDSGLTWSPYGGGIDPNAVRTLAISDDVVYAGTEAKSIFSSQLTETTKNTLSVWAQSVTRAQNGARATGSDQVTVKDQAGKVVSGVTVTAAYLGPNTGTVSAVTGRTGIAKLKTTAVRNPTGTWCFTVTNLAKAGYTYDPSRNVITTQCEGTH